VLAGGTAYAANTIGSSDIINGQVKSADIGNNQVRSADVRDDTIANGGLTGKDIIEGSLGTVPAADTLDGMDSKDFARLGGVVNGDGSILQGSGFTVSHPSDGEYQVSFPSGTLSNANCPPVATAVVFSGIVRNPQISGRGCSGLGAGSFTIKTLDNDGVAHDTPFVFMGM
jgi:hypothetical protein